MISLDRLAGSAPVLAPFLVVVAAAIVGVTLGLGPSLLVIAAGMLVAAISGLWSSLGRLTGESPLTFEEAVGLGALSPEEERKQSILRALKDLDYERSVGKISDADFAELTQRYRSEAKQLLQAIAAADAPRREKAEKQLAARLKQEGVVVSKTGKPRTDAKREPASERQLTDTLPEDPGEAVAAASVTPPPAASADGKTDCGKCGTRNDADSSFCKRCGAVMNAGAAS